MGPRFGILAQVMWLPHMCGLSAVEHARFIYVERIPRLIRACHQSIWLVISAIIFVLYPTLSPSGRLHHINSYTTYTRQRAAPPLCAPSSVCSWTSRHPRDTADSERVFAVRKMCITFSNLQTERGKEYHCALMIYTLVSYIRVYKLTIYLVDYKSCESPAARRPSLIIHF